MTKKIVDDDDRRPSIEHMRRTGHRVTYEEHLRFCRALGVPPRMGRPPKRDLKYKSINMRIDPKVLSRIRLKAAKRGIGYQTLINQILAQAA